MNFEKTNEIKMQPKELSLPWKPNLVEKATPKIETDKLFKKVDRLVAQTIRVNDRTDRPLMTDLKLKDLAPLLKGADLGQIIQCAVRFETQKMLSAPADYLAEKELENLKIVSGILFKDFAIAIDKEIIHEFLLMVIDYSFVAELLGVKDFFIDIENARYEIVSYVEQIIYDAIKATNYLSLCFACGVLKVVEYTFDFVAGTVLSFKNPELAEALYRKDFTSDVMKEIDSIYGSNEIIKKIGDVVESVGTMTTFMALSAIAAPETAAGIVAGIPELALYFATESGRSIKTLVSESGEYSGKEFFVGVVNGTISVCLLHLMPKICEKTKEHAAKISLNSRQKLARQNYSEVVQEAVAESINALYGAMRGCLQGVINEASKITNEKFAEITGIKDEAEINFKDSFKNVLMSGSITAASYMLKNVLSDGRWTSIELDLMQKETGWSYTVIDSIDTVEQYQVYKDANLHEAIINGRICLVKTIDFDYVDPKTGKTNRELMAMGRAPIDSKTGEKIELHHIGQKFESPFAELAENSEHGDGKDAILHNKTTDSWRRNPEKNKQYNNVERPNHWKARAEEV